MTAEYCREHGHGLCDCKEVMDDQTFGEVLAVHNTEHALRRYRAERKDETDYEDSDLCDPDSGEAYEAHLDDERTKLAFGREWK